MSNTDYIIFWYRLVDTEVIFHYDPIYYLSIAGDREQNDDKQNYPSVNYLKFWPINPTFLKLRLRKNAYKSLGPTIIIYSPMSPTSMR